MKIIKSLLILSITILSFSVSARTALGDAINLIQNPLLGSSSSSSFGSDSSGFESDENAEIKKYAVEYFKKVSTPGYMQSIRIKNSGGYGLGFMDNDYYSVDVTRRGDRYTCRMKIEEESSRTKINGRLVTMDECLPNNKNGKRYDFPAKRIRLNTHAHTKNKNIVDTRRDHRAVNKTDGMPTARQWYQARRAAATR